MTDCYSRVSQQSDKIRETNDCAVKAVAILTGKHYEDVHDLFRRAGRRRGRGTPSWMTHTVLRQMGYTLVRRTRALPKSVNQVAKLSSSKKWLVHTARHVLAVKSGIAHDWTAGRRHRPISVYQVKRTRKKSV